ncbi:MAG: SprT-like domain-containing protein [Planctomycetota bacterium]
MAIRKPTKEAYGELQHAYDFYNRRLFQSQLPNCLITMQRQRGAYGYFSGNRWKAARAKTDEIALNPEHFRVGLRETLSTLVHEMCHLWQHHFGKPGRRGYHNREWAEKMLEVGLHPSSTGQSGGKMTGDRMGDYIIRNDRFDVVTRELLAGGFKITWNDNATRLRKPAGTSGAGGSATLVTNTRQKYHCSQCGLNAWAKPNAKLVCGDCQRKLKPV